ncbi:MAG TPA: DNA translocase FtsK 4TM domain-containing protein, partial [bacterium]|nr:DNA translocase FtsK 4TM domain-containing protein [bacterium]
MKSVKKEPKKEAPNPARLLPEKEVQVPVKELVRDERTHKILGIASLLAGLFLFIAFTSYLFTWKEDQDQIFRSGLSILKPNDLHIANLLGSLGAYISHIFVYRGFGLASYLFCTTFVVVGINLLLGHRLFSLPRNLKYLVLGLIYFSTALGFFMGSFSFPYGGGVGAMLSDWLEGFLGKLGTTILLLVAGFAYVIWRFNPVFVLPARKPQPLPVAAPDEGGAKLFIAKKKNGLKEEGPMIEIPEEVEEEEEFVLVEKESEPGLLPERSAELEPAPAQESAPVVARGIHRPAAPASDLTLEIKAPVVEEVPVTSSPLETLDPYDPVLDLRDYQFPGLDLLDNHGSEKIVQDPKELEN